MRSRVIILAALAVFPIAAHAQTAEPPPFRFDTGTSIGWFTAGHPEPGNCCADWSSSLFKGVGGGYYWTDHLKSEMEIAWPGTTRAFSYSDARPVNGTVSYTYEEHAYRGLKVSASQLYQFGQNAMFHPFAGGGVDVDREEYTITRSTQTGSVLTRVNLSERELHTRPFVTTGFKAYFSERAFFRTELKVGFSQQIDQVIWKSGIGVDLGPRPRTSSAPRARETLTPRRSTRDGSLRTGVDSPELWRTYVAKLPIGSTVKVGTPRAERFVASLMAIDDTGILVKPKTRIPEPARHVSYDALEQLELYTDGTTAERGAAIAAGIGTGAGTFFLLLMALLSQID